jgi:hypothetical protein
MLKPNSLLAIAAFFFTLVTFCGPVFGQKASARDLYSEHAVKPSAGRPGAMVSIELNRAGRTFTVRPDFQFRSGDRIRLLLNINFNGYIALINHGTTGKKTLLFPENGEPGDLFKAGAATVPETGWIIFDDNPGIEKLVMVFSGNPIFGRTGYSGRPNRPDFGGRGKLKSEDEEAVLANLYELGSNIGGRTGGRDLLIESADNARYCVVNGMRPGETAAFELALRHR